jgi:tripartite-type tricarboxylate transporter receptor subunit TctC
MRLPEVERQLDAMGLEYPGMSSAAFKASLAEDKERWGRAIRELGILPE